ncbi:MAG: flippase-like domain-containing protein [Phycisphaerae bacterium]|nr:flippase-like domain-containing protein [Phycisphaerae bacterium]
MKKWIKYILACAILVFLVIYLLKHREQLGVLRTIRPFQFFIVYCLLALGTLNNSRMTQILIRSFQVNISLVESLMLQNAMRLLNLAPMKAGMLFRVNYLKKKYDLGYTHSISILVYRFLLTAFMAGVVGLMGVGWHLRNFSQSDTILAAFFGAFIVLSLLGMFAPLPQLQESSMWGKIINKLFLGRERLSGNKSLNISCSIHLFVVFILTGMRLAYIYKMTGYEISMSGVFVLGAVGFGATILAITPEALGIREVLLSSSAALLGLPFETGIMVSIFDRAMVLLWTFIVGTGSLAWFGYRFSRGERIGDTKQHTDFLDSREDGR